MPDQKPPSVRLLLGLTLFKIIVAPAILAAYLMTGDVEESDRSFANGLRTVINNRFDVGYGISAYGVGFIMGEMAIPLLILFLLLAMVIRRNFVWAIVAVSLDLLVSFRAGPPVLSIVMFLLVLTNPTKNYLKRKNDKSTPPPMAPIDHGLMNKE